MKFALLLTAVLSGLCAEVMAFPIIHIGKNQTNPVIKPDLDFNAASPGGAFPNENPAELVATDIEFDQAIDQAQFAAAEQQATGSFGVPEPPPATLIVIGLSSLGVFALWRRARWKRRQTRRRTVVRMRAIMAER
jgi:hypothetical protein